MLIFSGMAFYNREDELETLNRRWGQGRGEFFVVWGRRRVGKTELLSRFLDGKRGIFFEATEGLEPDHLHDLTDLLVAETGNELLVAQPLANWPAALAAIAEYARSGPAVVVLDEFQWVARATADIGSQLAVGGAQPEANSRSSSSSRAARCRSSSGRC